jgi:hypothetical protein
MSLIISVDYVGEDRSGQEYADYINHALREMGVLSYRMHPKLLSGNLDLPCLFTKSHNIDCLQFIASELEENPEWKPNKDFVSQPIDSAVKRKFILNNRSHLICHSSAFGCYIPIDYQGFLLPSEELFTCGSSFNLCRELESIANTLGFDLGHYNPDFDLLKEQRYNELINDPLFNEKMTILYLYNMCLASIEYQLPISFSG